MDSSSENQPPREQRRYPRVKARMQVEIQSPATPPARAETSDLSLCGCYLETMFTLDVGSNVKLTLWLDPERAIHTSAVVATRHPQVGNGFEFIDMPPDDRLRLKNYISTCESSASS